MARRERLYIVNERLTGTAQYEVMATSKRAALEKVRNSEVDMVDSTVDHTGRGQVVLATAITRTGERP